MVRECNQRISGILVVLAGMSLILTFAAGELCYSESKDCKWDCKSVSLLSGMIESYGQSRVSCFPPQGRGIDEGVLKMKVESRTEGRRGYAMCCVGLNKPIEVNAGDKILAEGYLKEDESEFHVKVETKDGKQQIFLYKEPVNNGKFSFKHTFNPEDLEDNKSIEVSRFCIAAVGQGALNTIEVRKAAVFPPGSAFPPNQGLSR